MRYRIKSWLRNNFKRAFRLFLAFAVVFSGFPWFGWGRIPTAYAATVNVNVDPTSFAPVYGGIATISWRFEDEPHATTLETCTVTPKPPEPPIIGEDGEIIEPPTPYDRTTLQTIAYVPGGSDKQYTYDWNGHAADGRPIRDGSYVVCVVPSGAEQYFNFYENVTIDNPAPPVPAYLHVVPNLTPGDNRHLIRGIAERGTVVHVEIRYTKRVGYDQVPGDTEHYTVEVPFDDIGTNEGSHLSWSKSKPLDAYFPNFPFRDDNKPQKYIREWELPVELHPYEIAEITASVERSQTNPYRNPDRPEKNKSGVSQITEDSRVLRYVAPEWNINWEALAGYYYRADSIESMVEGAEKIARDNGVTIEVCEDKERCPGFITKGWNLIIKNPLLAGHISQEEFLRDLTREMIANRKHYPKPLWWDPINLATGDFWFHHTNLRLEAVLPLEFTLTYHSRDSYDGAVGFGWHHSFEWRLEKREGGVMLVVTPEGARYPYTPADGGTYTTPAGTYNTLKKLPDGTYELETPQRMRYRFREDGRLTGILDSNGNQAVLTYQGTALKRVATDGASMTFVYGNSGKIASVTDQSGRRVSYEYDELTHDLKAIHLPDGAVIRFEYNDRHQMTAIHNPNETATLINVYDEQGRVVRQRDFSGAWGEIAYFPDERKTVTTDPLGRVKTFEYDERYRQTAIHYPDGTVERFEYDANDNLIRKIDRNGNEWTFAYDAVGNLRQIIDPLGYTTSITYNRWNKPEEITDALGNKTKLGYDDRGNLISVTDALGHTSTIVRDARGIPVSITNANGETITFTNDSFGFVQMVTDPAGFRQQLVRDPQLHRVTEWIDPAGNRSRIEYDPRDRVKKVIDALLQEETFEYDKNSNLIRYTDVSGATFSYAYDTFDRLKSVTDLLGHTTTFEYDAVGNRTKVTDAAGASTIYVYDSVNRVERIVDPEGGVWKFKYDGNGNLISREDPRGAKTSIAYDKRNLPIAITDASGATTTFTYDALGRLTSETNALGHQTRYEYDALGRLTKVYDALSQVTEFAYDKAGRLVRVTKPNGAVWHMVYDRRGLLVATVDPLGNRTEFVRDELGRVTVFKDETGAATTYTYDALGRVRTITNALGHTTTFTYDPLGRVTAITDAKGQVTSYEYDLLGRLTGVTNALGHKTTYTYDAVGNLTAKTDANGRVTRYEYDLKRQLTKQINPLNQLTEMVYDSVGNVTRITHPDGTATEYAYDGMNRLTRILYSDQTRVNYTYDAIGRRIAMTDANGTTTYAYDALNRLTQVTDAKGRTIRYEWTPTGQRSKVVYPDQSVVAYEYDLMDRLTKVTDGQGLSTIYHYDARGLLVSKLLPTQGTSTYSYDVLGQLLEIRHANQFGKTVEHLQYAYDPVGNRIRIERIEDGNDEDDADGGDHPERVITEYAYDALNQLTQVMQYNPGSTDPVITTYSYDAVGNRLTKETRWGDMTSLETYAYDAADKLLHWQNGADYKDFTYDPRGNLLAVTGVVMDGDADDVLQSVLSQALAGAVSGGVSGDVYGVTNVVYGVTNVVYGYPNAGGNPLNPNGLFASSGHAVPQVLEQYEWDAANRLVRMVNAEGDITRYLYDGDGNRIAMIVDVAHGPDGRGNGNGNGNGNGHGNGNGNGKGPKCHVVPPGFIPPGLAKKCGQYEEPYPDMHPGGPREGWEKQHKKKHWEFHFTNDVSLALPEPLMVTEADETKWKQTYVYGAFGERISMTYLPAYDHDNGWEPYPGAGGAEPGVAPRTLFYVQDALGGVLGLIEKDGRMSARYHYDEFGIPTDAKKFDPNWPGPDNLFGYTGLGYDFYSGLTYARARYYKPEIGRFISEDAYKGSLWEPQSQNLYAYVENNPIKYVDPSGNNPLLACLVPPVAAACATTAAAVVEAGLFILGVAGVIALDNAMQSAAPKEVPEVEIPKPVEVPATPNLTVIEGGNNNKTNIENKENKENKPIPPVTPNPDFQEKDRKNEKLILYHYTTAEGLAGILNTGVLLPSLKSVNPQDAWYGDGQYLTDILPNTKTKAQLSRIFIGNPFQGNKYTHYVAIDVTGLNVVKGREHVYVIPNTSPLNIRNRIVGFGEQYF